MKAKIFYCNPKVIIFTKMAYKNSVTCIQVAAKNEMRAF